MEKNGRVTVRHIRQYFYVSFSFFIAWALMIMPLPAEWQWVKPDWLALVLIYWILALPQSVGIVTGWSVGLIMDIVNGELIGQYALSMVLVAYFTRMLRYRLRLFPFWQQALTVLVLVGASHMVLLLVQWLLGQPPRTFLYWASTFSSVLFWPWIYRLLKLYERKAFG